jgi:hypothetical protein
MRNVIESLRLKKIKSLIWKWISKKKDNDDDIFGHPFAII